MKNIRVQLGIVIGIAIVTILLNLPRIPVKVTDRNFKFLNIDTYIGGYKLAFMNNKIVLDFTQLKKGLDIQGGVRVVLRADMSKIQESEKDQALESAKQVITRRIDLLGVSEPLVQTSKVGGDYRIVVELPGVSDVTTALNIIGKTAQLNFKQLKQDVPYDATKFQEYYTSSEVWEQTGVSGADLKGANVIFGGANGGVARQGPEIQLKFSDEGRKKFSDVAKANISKPIAIFLDEGSLPLSMPVVNPDLAQGLNSDPVITGTFSPEEASNLSISLRAGALPVPVEIIEQKTIGATLGQESVRRSLIAGMVGIVIVGFFMVFSYGYLGLLASLALIIYGLLSITVFKAIPITMTLPGIAGFILSIGMAVDANILTFERIKEEMAWGKPFNAAVKFGFERAWPSIRDSNIASLITCGILFYLGTGLVRGFALTLALGVLVSMFTALFVTHTLVLALYRKKD